MHQFLKRGPGNPTEVLFGKGGVANQQINLCRAEEFGVRTDTNVPVLVCSDGLTNHVDEATLWSAMARDDSCDAIVADLVSAANDAGGTDNITVVVARFLSEE